MSPSAVWINGQWSLFMTWPVIGGVVGIGQVARLDEKLEAGVRRTISTARYNVTLGGSNRSQIDRL